MTISIVTEELALLERVSKLLSELPEPPGPDEQPIVRELQQLREQLLARAESKDAVSLNEQWHRQNALLRQLRASRAAPRVDPRSPYFGHLRLEEDGRLRDVCLGRATRIARGVRIVDWRHAPVSKLFYRYRQGEEYEEEIAGRLRVGSVAARRTVSIRDGSLERVESPEGTWVRRPAAPGGWSRVEGGPARLSGGEGSALRAHGAREGDGSGVGARDGIRRVDKRLPEITGLIDPTQFELITRPRSGFLVIRGAAGSGKTTVALHRIAFLAYDDPEIDSPQTLFVVFSRGLRQYVDHVLPALGVERVAIRSYGDWAAEQRRRHFPALPAETRADSPALVQHMKLHPALGSALARQVERVPGARDVAQAIDDWASVLTQEALLEDAFSRHAPGRVGSRQIREFVEWNRRRLDELFQGPVGEEEGGAALDPEDDALLLRAWQLRVGPLRSAGGRPLVYRHVAVDEVQDFSATEVRVLLDCLDESRSLTLAGDTQQHLMEGTGFTSWSDFLQDLGLAGAELETLRVSYRSSRPIVEFSRQVLGSLAEDDTPPAAPRGGPPVECFRFSDPGACVAFLAEALGRLSEEEPLASVAVLTPAAELSAVYHQGLAAADVPRVRRVEAQDFTFAPGIEVTEIEQVKGLEFDYVIVVEATGERFPDAAGARRRLHVAATRAVHQLWLTCVGTPSPLLGALAP